METQVDREKRAAAVASADAVRDGMVVGLGTGSTVAYLLPELGRRHLDITCVATSPATAAAAEAVGLHVRAFDTIDGLDVAIDGADQVDPDRWLIKGGGGAHTRERIVAHAADRFVVIVSSNKVVPVLAPPVPLELMRFGLHATLRALPDVQLRQAPPTPDGGVLADYLGPLGDPQDVADLLSSVPGVVSHGLFPPAMVSTVLVGRGAEHGGPEVVEELPAGRRA
ncbi:MAG TPA: ribose 5-phosphate isomerase A [Acidimicrobiales bacterium]|nr:ribose 5-phosphate isomerase A [Acidimicrobiales bacterium]